MKNIAIVVGVVLLLGVGVWAIAQTGTNEEQVADTAESESTNTGNENADVNGSRAETDQNASENGPEVAFTSRGFNPQTVTIEPGTTVTWTNESDEQMWVASSVHPTHGDLPAFDQREGVGTDETYSYQFDQQGEWSFHNHLVPSHKGTVIVE